MLLIEVNGEFMVEVGETSRNHEVERLRVGTGTNPIQIQNSTCSMGGCGSRGGWDRMSSGRSICSPVATFKHPHVKLLVIGMEGCEQIRKTQDEPQWIVAQRLLSALTIPGFS